ncbi:ABC transporter permease [Pollutimonas bauzanensis]|uniref:ABC-type spermidine/putrescine transport system, permease component I n=1 Tax=Pollutimonas bauzanensis TaxID=658167 RepID=A0A1M5XUD8_9BURK|nr:ABC transporter permease [Pollutimonas bauzanensis]SHI03148.1 ABC-type spermidine/putrescine transport system, permease component I [Pollutimonas bauzanensis]
MSRRYSRLQPSLLGFASGALIISLVFFVVPIGFIATYLGTEEADALTGLIKVATSRLIQVVFLNTVEISVSAAILSVALAYPVALHIARQKGQWKIICLALVLMPFWTSILVKSYAFLLILGDNGIINTMIKTAFGGSGFNMMFNRFAVLVGMTNFLVPYAVFPILASLAAQNAQVQRAAEVMGASRFRIFWSITFIQSLPGLLAGLLMCLVISMGFFVTPALLGGRQDMMMANIIDMYTREILDWQSAALISMLLLVFSGTLSSIILKIQSRTGG